MSCIRHLIFAKKKKKPANSHLKTELKFEECIICFNPITFTETITLDCHHTFHSECILKWFLHNVSCPVCRQDVVSELTIQTTNSLRYYMRNI